VLEDRCPGLIIFNVRLMLTAIHSMTSLASRQTKSTKYRSIGCWRRNL
jgi:hypothetical protein